MVKMADDSQRETSPYQAQAMAVAGSPPVIHASRFAFYHAAPDVGLSFATSKILIDQASGLPSTAGLEWLVTVMMSPTLAQQLHEILGSVLADYEERFGAIPKDPEFKISQISSTPKK
jgi:hypothetical protein